MFTILFDAAETSCFDEKIRIVHNVRFDRFDRHFAKMTHRTRIFLFFVSFHQNDSIHDRSNDIRIRFCDREVHHERKNSVIVRHRDDEQMHDSK